MPNTSDSWSDTSDTASFHDALASGPPILGEPSGLCENCNERKATIRCMHCGLGGFCGHTCLELNMEKNAHVCVQSQSEETSAYHLEECIGRDLLPNVEATCRDYYFDMCPTVTDKSSLLGVYHTLSTNFNVSKYQFHEWMLAKQIHKNTVRLFNKNLKAVPAKYFLWLLGHTYVFSKEDDLSEVLNINAVDLDMYAMEAALY
ncbi:hypothetical protein EDB81DRAFT_934385 [Dactylonectria macrodidyma]|uniref:Uncharacterized protein n=1 Tax=Dactylonectria macrodidyma TaxID=307937 RepID=A0A9P9ET10_9HYPO|nr:hypothetical protein EDB81DRAFT_934385 [Dactylonectria macrodidyma]